MQKFYLDEQCIKNHLLTIWIGEKNQTFNGSFIKKYNENSDKNIHLKKMLNILRIYTTYTWSAIFNRRIKIKKFQKLVCNICNKEKYVVQMKTFKRSTKSWIIILKSTYNNKIWWKSLVGTMYWYECSILK